MDKKPIALFDMDGTLCDYVGSMLEILPTLQSPEESFIDPFSLPPNSNEYYWLWNRLDLIKAGESWWTDMPRFTLGFDVFDMATELGYFCEILTQSPKNNPAALAGKLKWIKKNLPEDIEFTMARNKSRHYGRVLVDDYPGYIIPWLDYRKKGLVIMPANEYNKDFKHPQVIRYDGSNKEEVKAALIKAME